MLIQQLTEALMRLHTRAAVEAPRRGGFSPIEEHFVTVPEAWHVRVCLGAAPRITATGTESTDERYVEIAVSKRPEERGTARDLLRGGAEAILAGLAQPNLPGLALRVVHELWRTSRWTEVMLTADHHQARGAPPTADALAAQSKAIADLLEGSLELPPGWQPILSPPLPVGWPLTAETSIATYVAASRPSPTSPTLIEVARPYARVVSDALCIAPPSLERLAASLEPAGTAAVRPISPVEIQRVQALPPLDAMFAAAVAGGPAERLHEVVRGQLAFFRARESWFYESLRQAHAPLYVWLDQPS